MFGKAEPYINHGPSGMFYGFNIIDGKKLVLFCREGSGELCSYTAGMRLMASFPHFIAMK